MKRKRTPSHMDALAVSPSTSAKDGMEEAAASPRDVPVSASKPSLTIPPILLEGDGPVSGETPHGTKAPPVSSGQVEPLELEEDDLPQTYGTGKIFLAARDPHCLYAHWDLTPEEQREFASMAAHPQLVLRVRGDDAGGVIEAELHVHAASRHWFVRVDKPGHRYVVELGHYQSGGTWRSLAISEAASTPRNGQSGAGQGEFETATFDPAPKSLSHSTILQPVAPLVLGGLSPEAAASSNPGVAKLEAHSSSLNPIAPPPPAGLLAVLARASVPAVVGTPAATGRGTGSMESILAVNVLRQRPRKDLASSWTAEQEKALAEIIDPTLPGKAGVGSVEIAAQPSAQGRLLKGEAESAPSSPSSLSGPSSPTGGEIPARGAFWLNLNVELVVYGATETDASVCIGGQLVEVRPDGSFTARFALPDGSHEVTVSAISPRGEQREARLSFQRTTERKGVVGEHPQDPALKKPSVRTGT